MDGSAQIKEADVVIALVRRVRRGELRGASPGTVLIVKHFLHSGEFLCIILWWKCLIYFDKLNNKTI